MEIPLKDALNEVMQSLASGAVASVQHRQSSQALLSQSGQTPMLFTNTTVPPSSTEEHGGLQYGKSYGSGKYGEDPVE